MTTKITRTINTASATITYVNLKTVQIESCTFELPTTQKVTEKEMRKAFSEKYADYQIVKVDDLAYSSTLYEMDLDTFIKYAEPVGAGRVEL